MIEVVPMFGALVLFVAAVFVSLMPTRKRRGFQVFARVAVVVGVGLLACDVLFLLLVASAAGPT